jgi:hypothetical protein
MLFVLRLVQIAEIAILLLYIYEYIIYDNNTIKTMCDEKKLLHIKGKYVSKTQKHNYNKKAKQ